MASIQASNTTAHIAAIADGQEKTVQLPRTRYDSALSKSIISKDHARATKGTIKPCPELSLVDSTGHTYTSRATISVRWHVSGGAQSFSETFYLVDSLGQYDAMLRRDIDRAGTEDGIPHVYAFVMEKESQAEKEMKKARERARVKEMEAAKARSEGRVRAQYEQKKGELARGRG